MLGLFRMLPVTQITVEEWLREMSFHYDLAGFPNPAHLDLFSTGTGTGTTWNFYRPVLPGTSTDWLYYRYRYYRCTDWLYYRLPVLPVYSLVILITDYRFADWRQTDVRLTSVLSGQVYKDQAMDWSGYNPAASDSSTFVRGMLICHDNYGMICHVQSVHNHDVRKGFIDWLGRAFES